MRPAVALLLLSACGLEETLAIELPDLESARSVVVSIERANELFVYTQNLDATAPVILPVSLRADETARIDVLMYDRTLEEMGLHAGRLVNAELEPRRPLPEPAHHVTLSVNDGSLGPPVLGTRNELLAAFRIPGESNVVEPPPECLTLSAEAIVLEGTREDSGWSGFEIAVSSTVVLAGTTNHEIFRITETNVERLALDPGSPEITAGSKSEDGQLWFADTHGSLWRGQIQGGLHLELVATSTVGPIDVLAVSEATAFAIVLPYRGAPEAALVRFDGARWRRLHGFCQPPDCDLSERFALEVLGPDEAIAMEIKGHNLVHYRRGELKVVSIPSTGFARCVEAIGGFGTIVGVEGALLSYEDGVLSEFTELGGFEVHAVARLRDGLIIGGKRGAILQLFPGVIDCPRELLAATDVVRFAPLGDAFLAIGARTGDANALPITVLRPE